MKRGVVGVLLLAMFGAACTGPSNDDRKSKPPGDLSAAEMTYGVEPKDDSSITYQPDVVLVGGGAASVMSQSNSGVSVVLKNGAPKLSDVKPGKVILVTGRIVGRVVGTQKVSGGVEVFMTPVQLTDVIKDAKIEVDTPIDLAASSVIQGQNFDSVPGATTPNGATEQLKAIPDGMVEETTTRSSGAPLDQPGTYEPATDATVAPAWFVLPAAAGSGPLMVPPAPPPPPPIPSLDSIPGADAVRLPIPQALGFPAGTALTGGYTMSPVIKGGVGVRLAYDQKGTKISAALLLKLTVPTVKAAITIKSGRITYAGILLSGAAGIRMEFEAGSQLGRKGNTISQVAVPLDFSIPLGGLLVLNWRQQFILKTGFSAQNSTLALTADYSFGGGIGFTYKAGHFSVDTPGGVTAKVNAVDNMNGISVGINSLVLSYQAKLILGIGAFGFASGLALGLNTSWGVLKSTDISVPPLDCRQVTFTMTGTVGIGWSIPKAVAAVVNFFLSIFNTSIPSSGGIDSAPATIAQRSDYAPDLKPCRI